MQKKRFTEEQIIGGLKEQEAGARVEDLAGRHGVCENTIYRWRSKYGGMEASEAERFRELEAENAKLKRLLADAMLDNAALKEIAGNTMVTPAARRPATRHAMTRLGLSERRVCRLVSLSRSALRYQSCRTGEQALRDRLKG